VTARVLHAPPSPTDSATVSLPAAALSFLCFCVHFHVSTMDHSLSICNTQMFMGLFGVWGRLGQSSYVDCMSFNSKEVIYLRSL
jgi:hypothetical protein